MGWVYVISNKSMPGLVKVGFTEKSPTHRALELEHSGCPDRYDVEYWLEVVNAYQVERVTHRLLASKRRRKEWFHCSPEEAVVAIKQAAGSQVIIEEYALADRARAETLQQQELKRQKVEQERRVAEQRLWNAEQAVHKKYDEEIRTYCNVHGHPFRYYWIGSAIASFAVLLAVIKIPPVVALFISSLFGAVAGIFLQDHLENRYKSTGLYGELERQRQTELETVRKNYAHRPIRTDVRAGQDTNMTADAMRIVELRLAAQEGNPKAQADLGWRILHGQIMGEDPTTGIMWMEEAARNGDIQAEFLLGLLFYSGHHVQQSFEKAQYWWKRASDASHASAQYFLGKLHEDGLGGQIDLVHAYFWYSVAAKAGAKRACAALNKIAEGMTCEQIQQGQLLANEFGCRNSEPVQMTAGAL